MVVIRFKLIECFDGFNGVFDTVSTVNKTQGYKTTNVSKIQFLSVYYKISNKKDNYKY